MINESILSKIRANILKKLQRKKPESLFQRLQIYDEVVGQFSIQRADKQILNIFQDIIKSYIETKKQDFSDFSINLKNQGRISKTTIFNSPVHDRKIQDDIVDPQLFSFSKTRKLKHKDQNHRAFSQINEQKQLGQHQYKNKMNSQRVRLTNNNRLQKNVSQFDSQISKVNTYELNATPIFQKQRKLKYLIIANRFTQIKKLLQFKLNLRNNKFKLKTGQYFHETNLLKKSYKSLKTFINQQKQKIDNYLNHKKLQVLGIFFTNWLGYCNRTQQQRNLQKKLKINRILLTKLVQIKKFIRNSQNYTNKQTDIQKDTLRQKEVKVKKWLSLTYLLYANKRRQQLKLSINSLQMSTKRNYFKQFLRMIKCTKQIQQQKSQKLERRVRKKISTSRFVKNLKNQYFFQQAYWAKSQSYSNHKFLNPRYQKILFIFQIFDCIQHNLSRKGYTFLCSSSCPDEKQDMHCLVANHSAYIQFYKPFKLSKLFQAWKRLQQQQRSKAKQCKYGIFGRRLYQGLLSWYMNNLQMKIKKQELISKLQLLKSNLKQKRSSQSINHLLKLTTLKKKQQNLSKFIYQTQTIRSLMVLKTYTVSKNYYRNIILEKRKVRQQRLIQQYFLQWKLICVEIIHNKLLQKDIQWLRIKFAMKQMKRKMTMYSIPRRIKQKKLNKLKNILDGSKICHFYRLLSANWKNANKKFGCSRSELELKVNKVKSIVLTKQLITFIKQIAQFWFQRRYNAQILLKIDDQYQLKLQKKSFFYLRLAKDYEESQKQLLMQIKKKKQTNTKKYILKHMIDSLIYRFLMKRVLTITRVYWDRILMQKLKDYQIHDK